MTFLDPSNPIFLPTAAEQQLTACTYFLSWMLYQTVNAGSRSVKGSYLAERTRSNFGG